MDTILGHRVSLEGEASGNVTKRSEAKVTSDKNVTSEMKHVFKVHVSSLPGSSLGGAVTCGGLLGFGLALEAVRKVWNCFARSPFFVAGLRNIPQKVCQTSS